MLLTRSVRTGLPAIIAWTFALAAAQAAVAAVRSLEWLLAATFAYGVSASLFSVTAISTLQTRTRDDMHRPVMALYAARFNGSALWGGPASQCLGVAAALAHPASSASCSH